MKASNSNGLGKETIGFSVALPKNMVDLKVLEKIIRVKGGLIKQSLGVKDLPVEVDGETVSFPWFDEMPEPEMAKAAMTLISAIGKMSFYGGYDMRKETAPDREQLYRAFLSRLGIVGSEHAEELKALTKNFKKD